MIGGLLLPFHFPRTGQVVFMTILTFREGMVPGEFFPVLFLIHRQHACPSAKRAGVFQGGKNRRPDELGAIGDAPQNFGKGRVHLEGDDVLFHHGHGLNITLYYFDGQGDCLLGFPARDFPFLQNRVTLPKIVL